MLLIVDLSMETVSQPSGGGELPVGPIDGVTYPLNVSYCGECMMPLEVWKLV